MCKVLITKDLKNIFRPSHADFTYSAKYGTRDWRGGGRASARETAARVVAGAFAKQFLRTKGTYHIHAITTQIGDCKVPADLLQPLSVSINEDRIGAYNSGFDDLLCCPHRETSEKMQKLLENLKAQGDSVGGVVTCFIFGLPAGVGEPVFGKLQARLAEAMLSIPAAHGFDYGAGFDGITMTGSQQNDEFVMKNGQIRCKSNFSGGIQGGITNGMPVYFRVLFKPPSSIAKEQQTVDIHGNASTINIGGRHDVCFVPRAVPVVEAMCALTLADLMLAGERKGDLS